MASLVLAPTFSGIRLASAEAIRSRCTRAMLKIEQTELSGGAVLLRLEGSIIGAWLDELRQLTDSSRKRSVSVVIDLGEVSFVSREGIEFLIDRQQNGVALVHMTPFVTKQLLGGRPNMNSVGKVVDFRSLSSAPFLRESHNKRALDGERRALEEFAARYGEIVLTESWRLLRNEEEALDLAHDVLRRAHRRSQSRQLEGDLKLWLQRLTAAAALGLMRAASAAPDLRACSIEDFAREDSKSLASGWSKNEGRETAQLHLRRALASLPLQLRAVVLLRDSEKMPVAEIAVSLGVEESCVRYRLNQARLALAHRMKQSFAGISLDVSTPAEPATIG